MKKKRPEILTLLLLVVSGLLITGKGFGAMNGAYTINQGAPASATNYMSVNSAMSDLQFGWRSDGGPVNGPGVTGPVTLRIVPGSGPYYEQVSVSFIPGTYPNVPVRLTGGATYETIEFTPDSVPDKHVIKLSGVMNLILDSLTIRNGARTSGYGVWITDNSDNNTIQNCRIELDSISTSAGLMGIAMISAKGTPGSNGSGNVISGNEIVGGYKGIVCNGKGTTEHAQKNQILGNRIYQSTNSGISLSYQDATLVSSNVVHSERDPYGGLRGIEINSGDSVVVEKNEVVISGFMGIIIANVNIGLPKKTMGAIARNNMVVLNRKKGYQHYNAPNGYGFYLYNSNIVGVAHNSVSFSLSDAGRGICVEKGSDYDIRNNSVYMPEAYNGYVIYTDSMSRIKVLDYNNYYVAGRARHFMYLGNEYLDTNYVGVGGFNLHSKVGNPYYLDPTRDLHTYSLDLDGAGDPTVGVGEDFDGEVRPNSPSGFPDIGADEYMPLAIDARVIKHLTPLDAICPDDNVVAVVIENMGTNPLNNINITSNITGASNDVISANYFGPLPSHKKDTLYVGAFNPGSGGKVQIETYCSVSGDQYLRNDTIRDSVLINPIPPQPVILKADTTCEGGQVELVVSASADSYWYDAASGGNLVYVGDTLKTDTLSANQSLYVETRYQKLGSLTGGLGGTPLGFRGIMFNVTAYQDVTIESMDLNLSKATGIDVWINYRDGGYQGFESDSHAWNELGVVRVDGMGQGLPTHCLLPSTLSIPEGHTYGIYIDVGPEFNYGSKDTVVSNESISIDYGLSLGLLFKQFGVPRNFDGTIYYTATSCPSPRTEVPVKVYKQPTPDLIDSVSCGPLLLDAGSGNGFEYIWSNGNTSQKNEVIASGKYLVTVTNGECTATDSAVVTVNPVDTIHVTWFNDSLFATKGSWVSYKWFVDGFELTGVNQNHIRVTQDGLYEVLATDANGCTDSDTIRVLGYVPVVSLGDEIGLHIYPNPNKGVFRLESDIRGATRVRIINAFGQVVLEKHVQGARQEFDLSGLPKGVYVLQIGTESFARMRFLIQ